MTDQPLTPKQAAYRLAPIIHGGKVLYSVEEVEGWLLALVGGAGEAKACEYEHIVDGLVVTTCDLPAVLCECHGGHDACALDLMYVQAERDKLAEERDEARKVGEDAANQHNELLRRTITCAFCGEAYPGETPTSGAEVLRAHIAVCAAHPMRAVESALAASKAAGERFRGIAERLRDEGVAPPGSSVDYLRGQRAGRWDASAAILAICESEACPTIAATPTTRPSDGVYGPALNENVPPMRAMTKDERDAYRELKAKFYKPIATAPTQEAVRDGIARTCEDVGCDCSKPPAESAAIRGTTFCDCGSVCHKGATQYGSTSTKVCERCTCLLCPPTPATDEVDREELAKTLLVTWRSVPAKNAWLAAADAAIEFLGRK